MSEDRETSIRRMQMRSMRRGIKEMDLILGGFARTGLAGLNDGELALYDEMLEENDHDLYAWSSGQMETPEKYNALLGMIVASVRTK